MLELFLGSSFFWFSNVGAICSSEMFSCDGSVCIPPNLLCDGRNDCEDGLDERRNCTGINGKWSTIDFVLDFRLI